MKLSRKLSGFALVVLLALSSITAWAGDGKVILASFNDMHGKIFSYDAKVMVDGKKVKEDVGGIARIATIIREIKVSNPGNVVVAEIGDTVEGPMFFYFHGKAELAGINAIPVDVGVPGNHEFDMGDDIFVEFIKGAKFPLICANLESDRGDISEIINPTWTTTLKNGTKVGFFGLLCTELFSVTSPGPRIRVGQDLSSVASAQVKVLNDQGCDVIVALTHIGLGADRLLARSTKGIHAILGGHSHDKMKKMEIVEGPDGWKTVIGQAGSMARYVGQMDVAVKDGVLDLGGTSWKLIDMCQAIAKAVDVEEVIKPYGDKLKEKLGHKVGALVVDADASKTVVRKKESALGNYLAEALLWKTKTQVALVNGGCIRGDRLYPSGDISYNTIMNIYPWGNTVQTFKLTGMELREVMEVSASSLKGERDEYDPTMRAPSGAFLQIAGIRVTYDLTKEPALIDNDSRLIKKGSRVARLEIKEGGKWLSVEDNGVYTVAVFSWTGGGGDKYYTFASLKGHDTYVSDADVLAEYIRHTEEKLTPYKDGRIRIEAGIK